MANRNYLYAKLKNNSFKGVSESSYMFSLYDCVLLTGNPKSVKSKIIDEAEELKTFLAIEADFDYGVKRYLDFNQWTIDNYEKIMTNS